MPSMKRISKGRPLPLQNAPFLGRTSLCLLTASTALTMRIRS